MREPSDRSPITTWLLTYVFGYGTQLGPWVTTFAIAWLVLGTSLNMDYQRWYVQTNWPEPIVVSRPAKAQAPSPYEEAKLREQKYLPLPYSNATFVEGFMLPIRGFLPFVRGDVYTATLSDLDRARCSLVSEIFWGVPVRYGLVFFIWQLIGFSTLAVLINSMSGLFRRHRMPGT